MVTSNLLKKNCLEFLEVSGIKPKIEVISSLILLFVSIIVITTSFGLLIRFVFGMELFTKFEEAMMFLYVINGGLLVFMITIGYMIYKYHKG